LCTSGTPLLALVQSGMSALAVSISDQNFGSKADSQALNICTARFAGAPVEVTEHGKILDVMPTQIGMMTSELVLFRPPLARGT
jgi:hypothetical protein